MSVFTIPCKQNDKRVSIPNSDPTITITGNKVGYRQYTDVNTPVILTAPHGGWLKNQGYKERILREDSNDKAVSDLLTIDLLNEIDSFLVKNNIYCYRIVSYTHRKYIDFNRSSNDNAYHTDDNSAMLNYNEYHQCINDCISDCRLRFPYARILLLDIHGWMQPSTPCLPPTIIIGNNYHKTCNKYFTTNDMYGIETNLKKLLAYPMCIIDDNRVGYTGQFTTLNYGMNSDVDALQLEFDRSIRCNSSNSYRYGMLVGEAIVRSLCFHTNSHKHIVCSNIQVLRMNTDNATATTPTSSDGDDDYHIKVSDKLYEYLSIGADSIIEVQSNKCQSSDATSLSWIPCSYLHGCNDGVDHSLTSSKHCYLSHSLIKRLNLDRCDDVEDTFSPISIRTRVSING